MDVVLVDDIQHLLTMSERLPLSLSIEFSLLVETIVDSSCYYKWHSADFDAITCYLAHVDWYELIYNFPSVYDCLLYTSPSPRDRQKSRMPSSA